MSITNAISRMEQIQSQIVQLSDAEPAQAAANTARTAAAVGSASASVFDSTLAAATGATGATVTPGAGQLAQNGTTGADVVADAQKYLGVPYVFGGTTAAGLDCSGLVQRVYADLGISLPRVVPDQGAIGQSVPSLADAQPGDLIVCNGGEHIVIYAGNGKIIQAPKPGGHVEEMDNWVSPSNVVTIRRIVPASSAAAQTAASGSSGVTGAATANSATAAILASLLTSRIGSSQIDALLGSPGGTGGLAALLGASGSLFGSPDAGGLSGAPSNEGLTSLLAQLTVGAER